MLKNLEAISQAAPSRGDVLPVLLTNAVM